MILKEYVDSDLMWLGLANTIAGGLQRGLMQNDRVSLAVPGGTTPGPLYDVLSSLDMDWDRVDVILTDERWVPESDPRSNAGLLRQHLLVDKAAAANFLPYYTGGDAPDLDLADVSTRVKALRPLSVVLLGMGTDMHTASLFPEGDNLQKAMSESARELVAMRAPGVELPRVTLSAPVINGAMSKHLVILGEEKLEALRRAETIGNPLKAPVAAVLDNLTVHWAGE